MTVPLVLALLQAPVAAPATHVLIVTGLGGERAYAVRFADQATRLTAGLEARFGVPRDRITWLAEDPALAPGRIAGKGTRQAVLGALDRMARTAGPDEPVLVVLIGHGSEGGGVARFNLPGPDLTPADLEAAFGRFPTQPIAVVNTASASGGFAEALAGPRRVVITATRSGAERNETLFAEPFVGSFESDAADTDKDGSLSLFEAYVHAVSEVTRIYEEDNRLPTEHARLSDEQAARRFRFTQPDRRVTVAGDSATAALLRRRAELEDAIASLRQRRSTMDSTDYTRALEDLLVDLARTNREIRERAGGGRVP